jgi:hypothetical protein
MSAITTRHTSLRCKAVKAAFNIRVMSDGAWLVSRWHRVRELLVPAAIERFPQAVGVAS